MLQLTDGTIMVEGDGPTWMRLTPDIHGSYVDGIWTANPIRPMSTPRLAFASQVLTDGRIWVFGGENSGPALLRNWVATGEIYDPVLNTWSSILPYPPQAQCPPLSQTSGDTASGSAVITGIPSTANFKTGWTVSGSGILPGTTIASIDSPTQIQISQNATATSTTVLQFSGTFQPTACFGDLSTMLLPGGQILAGSLDSNSTNIYNIAMNTWAFAASKVYDSSAEEGWVKMADGTILTYDLGKASAPAPDTLRNIIPLRISGRSISPSDGTSNGVLPLLSPSYFEIGPLLRLQDGRVFILGGNGHTALYTPTTNTWAPGPDVMGTLAGQPVLYIADDAPGATLPNGHVLWVANPNGNTSGGGTQIFDFNPVSGTIAPVSPACPDVTLQFQGADGFHMLVLPSGSTANR